MYQPIGNFKVPLTVFIEAFFQSNALAQAPRWELKGSLCKAAYDIHSIYHEVGMLLLG